MVLKSQPMSDEVAARVAREQTFHVETEARKWEGAKELVIRQWCVEKAIIACGQEAVAWFGRDFVIRDKMPPQLPGGVLGVMEDIIKPQPPRFESAVIPLAEDILRFITGGEKT